MKIFTENQLSDICQKWQDLLRLSHWDIAIRICKKEDMQINDTQASNKISLTNECALISILDTSDYPDSPFEQDMEVSLVHELLHIPLKYIANPEDNSLENIHLEAFIESTAKLLVKLSRKADKNDDTN